MIFRDARRDEVARIVALLADDELSAGRRSRASGSRRRGGATGWAG
jgi:hypothetical protein